MEKEQAVISKKTKANGVRAIKVNGVSYKTGFSKVPARKKSPWRELVASMKPGQWVEFPTYNTRYSFYHAAVFLGVKVRTLKTENGYKAWRVE